MRFFSKSKVPQWAAFFSTEQYEAFRRAVLQISNDKLDAAKTDDAGYLEYNTAKIGLSNLAFLCSRLKEAEWQTEIDRWIKVFDEGLDRPKPLYPKDISMLKLQLYPSGYFDGMTAEPIYREDIPGLLTAVVVDWPDMVTSLADDDQHRWSKHRDEIIDGLLGDLRKATPHEVTYLSLAKDSDELFAAVEGEDIMSATHALVLADLYPQLVGERGALVGIPNRHMLIAKKLDDEPSAEILASISGATQFIAHQNKYAVSDAVYRYEDGRFTVIASATT